MATETLLWMARYTRDLCVVARGRDRPGDGLPADRPPATSRRRPSGSRRSAARPPSSAASAWTTRRSRRPSSAQLWPAAKTDDVLAAFYVPDEGRVNPADLTQAYAKGARMRGARIVEGVTVTGDHAGERAASRACETDRGAIRAEYVVNAAGMWGREVGAMAGVSVPLQAAEHYYLITDTVPWAHPDLPIVEDPDRYGYYREEGGGILVGPVRAGGDGVVAGPGPAGRRVREPGARLGPHRAVPRRRRWTASRRLRDAGVRTMFCGPESFTPDTMPQLGEAPELRGFFVAAGLNSLGILMSGGVGSLDGRVDRGRGAAGGRHGHARRPHADLRDEPPLPARPGGGAAGRAVRRRGLPDLAPQDRAQRPPLRHPRPAGRGGRALRAVVRLRVRGVVRRRRARIPRSSTGGGGTPRSRSRPRSTGPSARPSACSTCRVMAKFLVQGRDAEARAQPRLRERRGGAESGRLVYTQWLNEAGGIDADLTVTRLAEDRFLVVVTDTIHRRMAPWIERHTPDGAHVTVTDVTAGTTLLTVQGPRSRELLPGTHQRRPLERRVPVPDGAGDRPPLRAGAGRCGSPTWASSGCELHVPADQALTVYDALFEAGARPSASRTSASAPWAACASRRPTATTALDIDNTDTPLDVGLGFAVAWDKPGGFVGREALLAATRGRAAEAAPRPGARRRTRSRCCTATSRCTADGKLVGHNRVGAYGHTLGGAVGLAMLEDEAGLPGQRGRRRRLRDRRRGRPLPGARVGPAALRPGPVAHPRLSGRLARGRLADRRGPTVPLRRAARTYPDMRARHAARWRAHGDDRPEHRAAPPASRPGARPGPRHRQARRQATRRPSRRGPRPRAPTATSVPGASGLEYGRTLDRLMAWLARQHHRRRSRR